MTMKSEFNFLFNTNQLKNTFIPRTNKGPGFKRISLDIYIQGKNNIGCASVNQLQINICIPMHMSMYVHITVLMIHDVKLCYIYPETPPI